MQAEYRPGPSSIAVPSSGVSLHNGTRVQNHGVHASLLRLVAGSWLDYVILMTAALVCFATPLMALRLTTQWDAGTQVLVALVIGAVCAMAVIAGHRLLPAFAEKCTTVVGGMPLWTIVALGFALRASWRTIFPATPGSDGATYLQLASKLAAGEPYFIAETFAYWPVGYPLYLSFWVGALGSSSFAYLASNIALYFVAVAGIYRTGTLIAGATAGKIAVLLFALWPNYIASTATPEKEMLIVALLPWVSALVLRFQQTPRKLSSSTLAGILLGYCVLVQPSLQFLLVAVALLLLVIGYGAGRRTIYSAVLLVASAATVIAPWTIRNYQVFDRFVLVSTNGGSNFYRANNPLATGGYTKQGAVKLDELGELERDSRGKQLALQWIATHPQDFGLLALEKTVRFTGDDAGGVYASLKVGQASDNKAVFAVLKGGANAFWMLIWMALAAACLAARASAVPLPALARLPFWLWLYLFVLHSVFESAGKYHVPVAWVLGVLLASYAIAVAKCKP